MNGLEDASTVDLGRRRLLRGIVGTPALTRVVRAAPLTLNKIRMRDPFILADRRTGRYHAYVQTGNRLGERTAFRGVEAYTSADLHHWSGPETVLELGHDSWARQRVWAPEVHEHEGRYYLLVTLTAEGAIGQIEGLPPMQRRGTQIFVADSAMGPFRAFRNCPHTPCDWLALDGTLWVEDGRPYMVFCHEWVQIRDGSIELMELERDLSKAAGEPRTLFRATEASWVRAFIHGGGRYRGYVTDGPFLHRARGGALLMMWSSFSADGYTVGLAASESGSVRGPWKQEPAPLFRANGGHSMAFRSFEDKLMLLLHQPNTSPHERGRLFELEDSGNTLRLRYGL
jgi:GH43 family beta-xylosidase